MIIVTPPAGSVPEPRPQALVTGDRAVVLVSDGGVTTTALVKAGVQIVTVSLAVYNEITSQLTPVTTDVDPATGTLKTGLLPAYLSQAAISALNVLTSANVIDEKYLPSRLSPANLAALMSSSGGTSSSSATSTVATIGTANITTATVSGSLSAVTATVSGNLEVDGVSTLKENAAPATPAAGRIVSWADATNRVNWKDPNGQTFLVGNKRIVSGWPADAQLGDEAINATSGEHRIYLGAKGWRLASPHEVTSLAERNALTNLYPGYRVYCAFGNPQDHVWDGQMWRGTKTYPVWGGPVRVNTKVNDTNWRRWHETPISDPGFEYFVFGRYTLEVVQQNMRGRVEVFVSICDQVTGKNGQVFHQSYYDAWNPQSGQNSNAFARFDAAPMTPGWMPQSGNRTVCIDWHTLTNNSNSYSGAFEGWVDWMVIPV